MNRFSNSENAEHSEIAKTVEQYIDGYLGQDPALLRQAFYENAKLSTIDEGEISEGATADWFARIEAKRRDGEGRLTAQAKILNISSCGNAAVANVQIIFSSYKFIDYLSLLKTNRGWLIVNKIYETLPVEGTST